MHALYLEKKPACALPRALQVCVVKEACGEQQQVWRSQLATVAADTAGVKLSPCIIVIGRVCEAADADRI